MMRDRFRHSEEVRGSISQNQLLTTTSRSANVHASCTCRRILRLVTKYITQFFRCISFRCFRQKGFDQKKGKPSLPHININACLFFREKGFDKKWVEQTEKKNTSGWEEVLIKGSRGTKSAAQKKAAADKVSQAVLKNADSVRVDIDGAKLMKLVEKDARKKEGLSRGKGENGQSSSTGAKPKVRIIFFGGVLDSQTAARQ